LITEALLIGILQLCAVTGAPVDCFDWMIECVNIEVSEFPFQQDDNVLEVCIETYQGDFLGAAND